MRRITHAFLVLVAILFLIEAWLWSHLEPIVAWIVHRIPLRRVKAALKRFLEWLPPGAALIAFLVPGVILFPLKLAAVWLIAHKQWLAATLVFGFAKLAGLGIAAFIFEVTKPQLLRMPWFRWLYERVLSWLDWAHALTDPIKKRIRKLMWLLAPQRGARAMRLLWRIRSRIAGGRQASAFAANADAARAARTGQVP
jgi:hypothetical protein